MGLIIAAGALWLGAGGTLAGLAGLVALGALTTIAGVVILALCGVDGQDE